MDLGSGDCQPAMEEVLAPASKDSPAVKQSRSREEEKLVRRKRRRRLRRMLRKAGEFPSFTALISQFRDDDEDDDDLDEDTTPDVIYVDVDEYLGLTSPDDPKPSPSTSGAMDGKGKTASSTPAEEGYYEGRMPMSSPDDDLYLTTLQQVIRGNLEYFSATAADAAGSQAGRRYPILHGKVGIRCIHCAKVGLEYEAQLAAAGTVEPDPTGSTNESTDSKPKPMDPSRIWPPGSISYPLNLAGLYAICSQKPQLHFEQCPNTPPTVLSQLYRHMNENGSKSGEVRIKSREVSAVMYYTVAAKRIGLVNVEGGLRFGRDLSLEPLPLDAVLAQELQENDEKKLLPAAAPPPDPSPSTTTMSGPGRKVDANAAQVLREALAESDHQPNHLARARDHEAVSDYIFLVLRQLAVCRAVPADFASRGKKTAKMRHGYAGFCCRHCLRVLEELDGNELARAHATSGYSCRSFSSNADTLASSIGNSFAEHLMKCGNVPKQMRSALATFKRSHSEQLAQLPHGSQRKKFEEIWRRLRSADVDEAEMVRRIQEFKPGKPDLPPLINPVLDKSINNTNGTPVIAKRERKTAPTSSSSNFNANSNSKTLGRKGPQFPFSKSAETIRILNLAEQNWDSSERGENGGIIVPSDRELVSDFIFLTCRNLRVALPTSADLTKGRRGPVTQSLIAGLCCMHCEGKDPELIANSSRTFPSAADNYASAFNTSLYNHMQKCHFIKEDLRLALADLRKLHSAQIGHLQNGAQRHYFNLLCNRLKKVPLNGKLKPKPRAAASSAPTRNPDHRPKKDGAVCGAGASRSRATRGGGDDAIFGQFRFFEAPLQTFICLRCRMVPLQFRARGSLCFAKPSIDFMSEHHDICKEDGFDLWYCVESLKEVVKTKVITVASMSHPSFKEVILECFGHNEDLATIFTSEIIKVYQMSKQGGVTRGVENYIKAKSQGMWAHLPKMVDSAKIASAFEKFAAAMKGLSPRLADHDALVSYLYLICPSLRLPQDGDEDDEVEEQEDGEDEKEEGNIENKKIEEQDQTVEIVETPQTGGRRGKELRKKQDDEDVVQDAKVKELQLPQRKRGKELRQKEIEVERKHKEDDGEEGEGEVSEADSDYDEVIDVTPRTRRGKELRKRKPRKPVYDDDDEEEDDSIQIELLDDDEDEDVESDDDDADLEENGDDDDNDEDFNGSGEIQEEPMDEQESSNGDVFDDASEGGIEMEGVDNQSDADALMREGINEDLEGEVSREQLELDDLDN